MKKEGFSIEEEAMGNQALLLSPYSKKERTLDFRPYIPEGRLVSGKRRRIFPSLGVNDQEEVKGTSRRAVRYKRKYTGKRKYKASPLFPSKKAYLDLKESDFHFSYLMHPASEKEEETDPELSLGSGAPQDNQEQGEDVLVRNVTILVLPWNSFNHTQKCLKALKSTLPDSMVEVVVFENGGTDGSLPYLAEQSRLVTVFQMYTPGIAEALKWALVHTEPENDIVLLQNDLLVQQQNWIELFQETAYSSLQAGIVGSRLTGGSETHNQQFTSIYEVKEVDVGCSYWRRELLNQLGPLDIEKAFHLGSADYCLMAKKAGFKIFYDGRISSVRYRHVPDQSPSRNKSG